MPYLVDSNILLRICDRSSADHEPCLQAVSELTRHGEPCHTCAQTLIESWVVAIRPRDVNGLGLSPTEALANLVDFQLSMPCLSEPPHIAQRWQSLVAQHEVRGRKAHDVRLVAFMEAYGLSDILTLNAADFARFHQVRAVSPRDIG